MSRPSSRRSAVGSLVVIAAVVGGGAAAFAYTAGWLSPERLTPARLVDTLAPPGGPALGHRRNHAKGICFTGTFEANGAGAALSKAQVLASGRYPVVGRFNFAGPDPTAADASARVRGLSYRIRTPDGQEWRAAMIDPPFFPVASPQAFYELQQASAKKDDPDAMKDFAAAHPEIAAFGAWAKSAPFLQSYAEERFNSLDSFVFTDASGADHVVRWSLLPAAPPTALSADEMQAKGPNFLEEEIGARVAAGAQRWTLAITVADAGDPTADPSQAWPDERRTVDAGTLVVDRIVPEPDGPCRDINFDPTVLPAGMRTSDDPFPAARSAAYSVSFNRRAAEADHYPREPEEASK
ncbi:catalase family peroxidase [Aureimonas leprariae]|uniref:Catalase-related peroxidase n=1 Tax=Plantimonas leprariae TaxID=2615207 RepID=A0A7V7TVI5_9HYPH|nr:catalase family peroxidase [Aureimonas leprariae]KAB0678510.1 catalase family peroxidase [Aureimonas leprariae]